MSSEDLLTETWVYSGEVKPEPFSFGSLFMGVLPFVHLGPKGRCSFQVDNLNQSRFVEGRVLDPKTHFQWFSRVGRKKFAKKGQVDVLLVRETRDTSLDKKWMAIFARGDLSPKVIVYMHKEEKFLTQRERFKHVEKHLEESGYVGMTKLISSSACGSPTHGSYLVTFFFNKNQIRVPLEQVDTELGNETLGKQGFQNCLIPAGKLH